MRVRSMSSIYYSRRSFLKGMSRIIDLGGTLRNRPTFRMGWKADTIALRTDWEMIGRDIREAITELESEEAESG